MRLAPVEAAVVAELFARGGIRLVRVALGLSAQGTPTPRGHWRWNQPTLGAMLSHPTDTGQVYARRPRARAARVRRSATHPLGHPASGQACTLPEKWVPVATVPAVVKQFDRGPAKRGANPAFARRPSTAHDHLVRALGSGGGCQLACLGRSHPSGYSAYGWRGQAHPGASCRDAHCHARLIPPGPLDALVRC